MEFFNSFTQSRQDKSSSEDRVAHACATKEAGARLPRRKPSLSTNFSYPRLSRHESRESQSSNDSVPGMTDASDSDLSFEDDGVCNTSADEASDSFWLDGLVSSACRQSQEQAQEQQQEQELDQELDLLLKPGIFNDYSKLNLSRRHHAVDAGKDAIRNPSRESDSAGFTSPRPAPKLPSAKNTPKENTSTYSTHPKPPPVRPQQNPHPPRTSSLSFGPLAPPPPPSLLLRNSRSSTGLKSNMQGQTSNSTFIAPSLAFYRKPPAASKPRSPIKAASAPVSPAYPPPPPPPPPPPRRLRPTTSAFSLRDKMQMPSKNRDPVSHNVTAPLAPLLPSALPEPLPRRPQPELCVSVFEYDSDSDTETDDEVHNSFARRIARGLHRKSASEKRCTYDHNKSTGPRTSADGSGKGKSKDEESPRRSRGGSLGRIFGFKGKRTLLSP